MKNRSAKCLWYLPWRIGGARDGRGECWHAALAQAGMPRIKTKLVHQSITINDN